MTAHRGRRGMNKTVQTEELRRWDVKGVVYVPMNEEKVSGVTDLDVVVVYAKWS